MCGIMKVSSLYRDQFLVSNFYHESLCDVLFGDVCRVLRAAPLSKI